MQAKRWNSRHTAYLCKIALNYPPRSAAWPAPKLARPAARIASLSIQSSPPEQRRSSKRRNYFELVDDEGVGDDRMPRGGEERGIAPWPPPKGGEPSPSTIDPHDTAPSSVGFSQRGGVLPIPQDRQHLLPIPLALVGRAGRARTGCGFLDPHHQPQELPICRACARSLTRDLGWPRLARSTLRRHCRCPVARPHVPASRLNHRYPPLPSVNLLSSRSPPFQMNLRVYRRSRV